MSEHLSTPWQQIQVLTYGGHLNQQRGDRFGKIVQTRYERIHHLIRQIFQMSGGYQDLLIVAFRDPGGNHFGARLTLECS
jgi:hypothetical protein